MAESKEVNPPNDNEDMNPALATTSEEHLDDEDDNAAHATSTKAKKKKKKSRLKSFLSRKPDHQVKLEDVEEAISSASLEERKSLSKEEQDRIEKIITQLNAKIPGGRKDLADHKFWKTQPVIKFGIFLSGGRRGLF
jgi:hypothetical protein